MKWQYKGEWFKSIPIDWDWCYNNARLYNFIRVNHPNFVDLSNKSNFEDCIYLHDFLVYVPKYDKCYTIQRFGTFGNGNQTKMYLEDIYTKKDIYVMAKDVELVVKCN